MNPPSLIVIGGGPGGYAAALEAARRQLRVTLIEQREIGGVCLNRGCIPSKFLLSQSKLHSATPSLLPSMAALQQRKNALIGALRQRMEQALKNASIQRINGRARLASANRVEVERPEGGIQTLEADALLLATGSLPVKPTLFPEHPAVLDSTSLLDLDRIPGRLVVVGAGYVGCELACAFQGLGSKVTLLEKESRLLPTQDELEAAAAILHRSFEKRGMTVWLQTQVEAVEPLDDQRLRLRCSNGQTLEADALLLAMGRRPDFQALALDRAGLALQGGRLRVNERMQTAVSSIYAIGDLVSPLPLAHAAAREAEVAVAALCGETKSIDYVKIPRCVYTWPEAAAVGLTETQARAAGYAPRVDRCHFAASSKAMIEEETEGFWLLVSDSQTRRLLGGQIVGPHATELIHLLSLALNAGLGLDDIGENVFAHPSLSEGFQEAARRAGAARLPAKPL